MNTFNQSEAMTSHSNFPTFSTEAILYPLKTCDMALEPQMLVLESKILMNFTSLNWYPWIYVFRRNKFTNPFQEVLETVKIYDYDFYKEPVLLNLVYRISAKSVEN